MSRLDELKEQRQAHYVAFVSLENHNKLYVNPEVTREYQWHRARIAELDAMIKEIDRFLVDTGSDCDKM